MKRFAVLFCLTALLVACVSNAEPPRARSAQVPLDRPAASTPAPRAALPTRGLEAVIGKDRQTMLRLFGQPRLDVIEVQGRKLQFSGRACILDAYLYPDGRNGQEIVTHVDARRSDGAEVDRVQCINALMAR